MERSRSVCASVGGFTELDVSRIPGRASRPSCCRTCLIASARETARARGTPAAWVSASRSCARSWPCTADGVAPAVTVLGRGATFVVRFPARQRGSRPRATSRRRCPLTRAACEPRRAVDPGGGRRDGCAHCRRGNAEARGGTGHGDRFGQVGLCEAAGDWGRTSTSW